MNQRFTPWEYQLTLGDNILIAILTIALLLVCIMFVWALVTYKEAGNLEKQLEDPTIDPFQFDDVLQSN